MATIRRQFVLPFVLPQPKMLPNSDRDFVSSGFRPGHFRGVARAKARATDRGVARAKARVRRAADRGVARARARGGSRRSRRRAGRAVW